MSLQSIPFFHDIEVDPTTKVALIRSIWHEECTQQLVNDAKEELMTRGVQQENIIVLDAPGSFEIPLIASVALQKDVNAVIAFGVIVEGDTYHAELVARESARALMDLSLHEKKPITFEILYVKTLEDAKKRCIGPHGKGALAAQTMLSSLAILRKLKS